MSLMTTTYLSLLFFSVFIFPFFTLGRRRKKFCMKKKRNRTSLRCQTSFGKIQKSKKKKSRRQRKRKKPKEETTEERMRKEKDA